MMSFAGSSLSSLFSLAMVDVKKRTEKSPKHATSNDFSLFTRIKASKFSAKILPAA